MATLDIITYPHKLLRDTAKMVEFPLTDEQKQLIGDMLDTMYFANGAGLGANQVGRPEAIFVLGTTVSEKKEPTVCINPFVVEKSREQVADVEGCLSLPNISTTVKRSKSITIRAQDMEGNWFDIKGEGYLARALQHEMEHLQGKLFIDNIGITKRQMLLKQMSKVQKHMATLARQVVRSSAEEESI